MDYFTKKIKQLIIMPKAFQILMVFLLFAINAQAQVILNTQRNLDVVEDGLIIDVTAENFTDIAGMQMTINWDPSILQFEEALNFQLQGLTVASFNPEFIALGELPLAWLDASTGGQTIEHGGVLFSLKFNVLSSVPTEIFFDDTPTPIEFINSQGQLLGLSSTTNTVQTSGHLVKGKVFVDEGDCVYQEGEIGLVNWMIQINDGTRNYYRQTKENGDFTAFLPAGDFTFTLVYPENNYWSTCQIGQQITIMENAEDATELNFGVSPQLSCPALSVAISTPFIRRCFENVYQVDYTNSGTQSANDAFVLVQLPTEMSLKNSGLAPTLEGENQYRFDIGDVPINSTGKFNFIVEVDCETTELGQTHCVSAQIFPDIICSIPASQWSKASLMLEGKCNEDKVQFKIKNIGTGDMLTPAQFVIIEDMIMLRQGSESFQLPSGTSYDYELPANGSTFRMETDQVPFHPFSKSISAGVEGCGTDENGETTRGFITMFDAGDDSPFMDIDCQQNIGAFDPNDKAAYPVGYGERHYIDQNQTLTYHIRFQNTGTDTAFNIVVIDTLSEHLEVATFEVLTTSHDYEVEILDSNILKFSFNDIMLVDSFQNEPLSHGFIRFEIDQQPDVDLGTVITNSAAIFFDFNEPVITNTTFQTVGKDFVEVDLRTNVKDIPHLNLKVAPNPFAHSTIVNINNPNNQKGVFYLYDLNGRLSKKYTFSGNQFELMRSDLETGLYLFEVHLGGVRKGGGKLSVK